MQCIRVGALCEAVDIVYAKIICKGRCWGFETLNRRVHVMHLWWQLRRLLVNRDQRGLRFDVECLETLLWMWGAFLRRTR